MNSETVFAGNDGCTAIMNGTELMPKTGVMSRRKLYCGRKRSPQPVCSTQANRVSVDCEPRLRGARFETPETAAASEETAMSIPEDTVQGASPTLPWADE